MKFEDRGWLLHTAHGQWLATHNERRAAVAAMSGENAVATPTAKNRVPLYSGSRSRRPPTHQLAGR